MAKNATEKKITNTFKRITFLIKKDILSCTDKEFSLLSKISEMNIRSLLVKGDAHEKVSTESAFKLIQLTGKGDTFAKSISSELKSSTYLPPSPLQELDTGELALGHGAYINMLKVMESSTLHAIYDKNITKKGLSRQGRINSETTDGLFAPDAYKKTIGTIGAWSRWMTLVGLDERALGTLEDIIHDLGADNDKDMNRRLILEAGKKDKTLENLNEYTLGLEMRLQKELNKNPGLSFSPGY